MTEETKLQQIKDEVSEQHYSLPYSMITNEQALGLIDYFIIAYHAKRLSEIKDEPSKILSVTN